MASRRGHSLAIEPLTAEAFRPFGDVIETGNAPRRITINEGWAERFDDLAAVDVLRAAGRPCISLFRARPRVPPFALRLMERHPLGSQAFMPLSGECYLVAVCPGGE
jgi:ureidoglycolate lyase